jgi:hypothetical protein
MPLGTLSSCNDPKTTDFVSKNFAGRSAPVRAALNSLDTVVCFVEHDGAGACAEEANRCRFSFCATSSSGRCSAWWAPKHQPLRRVSREIARQTLVETRGMDHAGIWPRRDGFCCGA